MAKERKMEMRVERSKTLHNFTLPCDLRWGNQRHLRCSRVNSDGQVDPSRRRNHSIQQRRTARDRDLGWGYSYAGAIMNGSPEMGRGGDEDYDGIEAMRKKVMFDLQAAAKNMQYQIWKDEGLEEERDFLLSQNHAPPPTHPTPPLPPPTSGERPWNLRTRRAVCKMPATTGKNCSSSAFPAVEGKGMRFDSSKPNSESHKIRTAAAPVTTHRSTTHQIGDKKERPKFTVPLSKREIEEDFFAMAGHRPPRRPKKRTKTIQKDLDSVFPGLWLTEITTDLYRVSQ